MGEVKEEKIQYLHSVDGDTEAINLIHKTEQKAFLDNLRYGEDELFKDNFNDLKVFTRNDDGFVDYNIGEITKDTQQELANLPVYRKKDTKQTRIFFDVKKYYNEVDTITVKANYTYGFEPLKCIVNTNNAKGIVTLVDVDGVTTVFFIDLTDLKNPQERKIFSEDFRNNKKLGISPLPFISDDQKRLIDIYNNHIECCSIKYIFETSSAIQRFLGGLYLYYSEVNISSYKDPCEVEEATYHDSEGYELTYNPVHLIDVFTFKKYICVLIEAFDYMKNLYKYIFIIYDTYGEETNKYVIYEENPKFGSYGGGNYFSSYENSTCYDCDFVVIFSIDCVYIVSEDYFKKIEIDYSYCFLKDHFIFTSLIKIRKYLYVLGCLIFSKKEIKKYKNSFVCKFKDYYIYKTKDFLNQNYFCVKSKFQMRNITGYNTTTEYSLYYALFYEQLIKDKYIEDFYNIDSLADFYFTLNSAVIVDESENYKLKNYNLKNIYVDKISNIDRIDYIDFENNISGAFPIEFNKGSITFLIFKLDEEFLKRKEKLGIGFKKGILYNKKLAILNDDINGLTEKII